MASTTRGTFIVFEGLDRAGKSTQCSNLAKTLEAEGRRVKLLRFPDRTTAIGTAIDQYLRGQAQVEDHVIHLLFSANRWEAAAQIEADLASGTTVIVDRYYYSGIVYSAAKMNPTLSLEWARKPDEGLPRPDICLFLDISAEDAARRGGFGKEKYEKQEMQDRVRQLFQELRQGPDGVDFVVIDGGKGLDEVAKAVLSAAEASVKRVQTTNAPLRYVEPWVQSSVSEH